MSREPGRKAGKCLESREVIKKPRPVKASKHFSAGKCLESQVVIKKDGGWIGL
jgi:hypothetical protein